MSKAPIYLDYAAGTPSVVQAPALCQQAVYNPSALYQGAVESQAALETSRLQIAQLLAVKAQQLVFIPGATAINNLVIETVRKTFAGKVVALNVDHDSLRLSADKQIQVNQKTGQLDEADILGLDDDVCLLSLAGVNSETGSRQDFRSLKRGLTALRQKRKKSGCQQPLFLHIDASQMVLTDNPQPQALAAADFITFNGGKFYALKQSGFLYVARQRNWQHLFKGGDYEAGWWPGTPSILAAAVLSQAFSWVAQNRLAQTRRLQDIQLKFEAQLKELGATIVLEKADKSCCLTTALMPTADNEWLALKLSEYGIYVGIGSACHSRLNSWQRSALRHLGYGQKEIYRSLRFSFGYETQATDLEQTIFVLKKLLKSEGNSKERRQLW